MSESTFKRLCKIDLSGDVEVTQNQKYIPWNKAVYGFTIENPDMEYEIHESSEGLPFFVSPLGIMVKTSVTVEGKTKTMWRPVLNSANKAMKTEPYSYQVKEWVNGKWNGGYTEKHVEAATTTDINEANMRCLVKNFAMHGYGIHIFTGSAIPEILTLDSNQMSELTKMASDHGVNIIEFNSAWGINNLSELHECNFEAAKELMENMAQKNK